MYFIVTPRSFTVAMPISLTNQNTHVNQIHHLTVGVSGTCVACTYWTSDKWLFGQVHHIWDIYHWWNATPYTSQQLEKLWLSLAKPVNNEWHQPKEREVVLYINPLTEVTKRVRVMDGHHYVQESWPMSYIIIWRQTHVLQIHTVCSQPGTLTHAQTHAFRHKH